ncbi:MAG TPA: type IV toxin-antitoxin system AbiEi family antitoxin domain-containing protein, partial [Pseudonocardia sp.]|nr:type IV toxin-antitoxin system AbiEi family antitoxin domain-containing protein [Pseudonocardia sp.]
GPAAGGGGPCSSAVRLERVLERQAGVVSLAQAVAAGMSADVVRRRAAAGRWTRLHPGIYLAGGHRLSDAARVWAAWLWAGAPVTVSGTAAAFCHGMLARPGPDVELTVPRSRSRPSRPGVRVRRRDLPAEDVTRLGGLTVTAVPLTALEAALRLPDGTAFLDRALQQHVGFEQVLRAYHRHLGARGWPAARGLLSAAATGAESTAERLLVGLLEDAGIDGWVLGHRVGPWRIDLAFPAAQVAIEVDGWAWHHDVDRFRGDRRKQNALVRAGWVPLRFTWHDLAHRPAAVLAEIRGALAAAA